MLDEQEFLALTGYYRVHAEDAGSFRAIAADSVAKTSGKDGCLYYSFAEDVAEPGLFRLAEGWRDREALDRHLASPDFKATLQNASALRITERKVFSFTASEGHPLF